MNLLFPNPITSVNDCFVGENSVLNFDPILKDFRDPIVQGRPNEHYRFEADFYKKIGVDIVTETVFEYPYNFVTEKSYRSVACLRPFIIVGPYQTLQFLRSLGFKTFSAIINESYDNISDPEERFIAVCNSIEQFVDRPLEQIKQDLHTISDVLIHNRVVLENLYKNELEKFKNQL